MPPYQLTVPAESDLKDIARYTRGKWGEQQAMRYGEALERCFRAIADKTAASRNFSKRFPQVFVTRCEHHRVFFLHPEGQPPCIIAVLHERMDFVAWLDRRL
jgi:plasmid stabilization system protein ParE